MLVANRTSVAMAMAGRAKEMVHEQGILAAVRRRRASFARPQSQSLADRRGLRPENHLPALALILPRVHPPKVGFKVARVQYPMLQPTPKVPEPELLVEATY